jgi:hypothetical protein
MSDAVQFIRSGNGLRLNDAQSGSWGGQGSPADLNFPFADDPRLAHAISKAR